MARRGPEIQNDVPTSPRDDGEVVDGPRELFWQREVSDVSGDERLARGQGLGDFLFVEFEGEEGHREYG